MAEQANLSVDNGLQILINKLEERYDPTAILYFGSVANDFITEGPFQENTPESLKHYFLLVITDKSARIDHEMQEFATNNSPIGTVTILSHGKQTVSDYINKGNRFFLTVLRHGKVVYPGSGLPVLSDLPLPEIDHQRAYLEAERDSSFHLELADGFYAAVNGCLESNNWYGAAFLANQTIEQICLALNQTYLGYRADIHSIDRLLKLCTCYTQELTPYFPKQTAEHKRLYRLLNAAFNDARYGGSEFVVESSDAFALASILDELMKVANRLCERKLAELKAKAGNAVSDKATTSSVIETPLIVNHRTRPETIIPVSSVRNAPDFCSSRQKILELLVAVIKPAKIYAGGMDGSDWRDGSAYVHFVIVISNKKQDAFKDIDPLIGLARLGDSRLTCSLHQCSHLQDKLSNGHVFYSPVCVPANLIHDDEITVLKPTKECKLVQVMDQAGKDFRAGMLRANSFLNGARYYYDSLSDKAMSCFMLQQAAELTYRTVILVLYGLDVRSHSIFELRKHVSVCAPGLNDHLPAHTNEDKRLVTKLEDAYTAARYKDTFQISDEAFSCLSDRVGCLVDAAIAICDQRFPVLPVAPEIPVLIDNSKPYSATFFQAD